MVARLALLVTLATAVAAAASSAGPDATPRPLRGLPLRGSTGLRLLVAHNPPFVLDVDTGRRTRIGGLKPGRRAYVGVYPVGRDAVVWVAPYNLSKAPRAQIYVLRNGTAGAARLATAWDVAAAADRSAVWLKSYVDPTHCTLREVSLDGRELESSRPVTCSVSLVDSGSGALLVDETSVLDPSTGQTVLETADLWAVAGDSAITSEVRQGPLAVTNLRSGERWQFRYPSRITGQGGNDEAAVHPNRRLVALSFSDPAYNLTATQVTDVWLLNVATRRLSHLPDMPAAVALKFTSMRWSSDGKLVLLARTLDGQNLVAVWRPGRKRIRVRPVRIPAQHGSFIVWGTGS